MSSRLWEPRQPPPPGLLSQNGLPLLTSLGILAVAAQPRLARDEHPGMDAGQHGIGDLGEPASVCGRADGVMLLELGLLQLAHDIEAAIDVGGGST